MSKCMIIPGLLLGALTLAHGPAQACGENQFNMGQGLRYQNLLAPRPATVLVFDESAANRKQLYSGMVRAGHKVTVVSNSEDVSRATNAKRFDVIIAELGDAGEINVSPGSKARVLPVVKRQQRNQPELRDRFDHFVIDGASLGQYLKSIDHLVQGKSK